MVQLHDMGGEGNSREVYCCLYLDENDVLETKTDIRFEFRATRNPNKQKKCTLVIYTQ